MKILFDGNALQSQAHNKSIASQPHGIRLRSLLSTLQDDLDAHIEFSKELSNLSEDELNGIDILTIPTRIPKNSIPDDHPIEPFPFSGSEIRLIKDLVHKGLGLVILTNHPPFTVQDQRLAKRFGISILKECEKDPLIDGDEIYNHPINQGYPERQISSLEVNNCALLKKMNDEVDSVVSIADTKEKYFCLANNKQNGRLVVVADSGFIGSKNPHDSDRPGPAKFQEKDNRNFVLNIFQWVGG